MEQNVEDLELLITRQMFVVCSMTPYGNESKKRKGKDKS
jgi:hypothetical protein